MLCTYIHICINLYCKDVRECVCVRACVPKAAITSREFQDELSQREFDIFRSNPLFLFFDIAWPLAFFYSFFFLLLSRVQPMRFDCTTGNARTSSSSSSSSLFFFLFFHLFLSTL